MPELANMRPGSEDSAERMAKTVAAVRRVKMFSLVSRNLPQEVQELNSALRSCALEANRSMVKGMTKGRLYKARHDTPPPHSESTESMLRAYLVDQKLQVDCSRDDWVRSFKRFGDVKPA